MGMKTNVTINATTEANFDAGRKFYTFEHKDGNTKSGTKRMFGCFDKAEAQHYAACHYDSAAKMPFISEWSREDFAYLATNPEEIFSRSDAKSLIMQDARTAANGSPIGKKRAVAIWADYIAGRRDDHCGKGMVKPADYVESDQREFPF